MERAKKSADASATPPAWFTLLLSGPHAAIADKHVPMYVSKGLLRRADTTEEAAAALGVDHAVLVATLSQYEADAVAGYVDNPWCTLSTCCSLGLAFISAPFFSTTNPHHHPLSPISHLSSSSFSSVGRSDAFGKKMFPNPLFLGHGPFYFGTVTPTLHYCMGGLHIDNDAHVLAAPSGHRASTPLGAGAPIPGLFAAGEVVGGIHGNNRLAGNALTECVVFGRIAAKAIFVEARQSRYAQLKHQSPLEPQPQEVKEEEQVQVQEAARRSNELPVVGSEQLRGHDGKGGRRLWSAIHG